MKYVRLVTIVALCLALMPTAAVADKASTLTRLSEGETPQLNLETAVKTDCQVGNLNPIAGYVPGFFTGQERYKYLIYPPDQCGCPDGFLLENVNMMLHFDPWMVPVTFDVQADLGEAVWDPVEGCWVPGPDLCLSSIYSFTVTMPGDYIVTVPMDGCDCAHMDFHYFIGLNFLTAFEANLVIDGFPQQCITYNDKGLGWEDLFFWFMKSAGKVIVWGDVICCQPAVPAEPGTWGSVKSLYR